MDPKKSLDNVVNIIAALLHDVQNNHGVVFNDRARKLTLNKLVSRVRSEGIGFLTKALPRLGKAFDKALSGSEPLDSAKLGFKPQPNSKLPKLFGELFNQVLNHDGVLLQNPCATSVQTIRQVLYLYYKYKLGYNDEQERKVIEQFERTEQDLSTVTDVLDSICRTVVDDPTYTYRRRRTTCATPKTKEEVVREARILLSRLFAFFDPKDILPRHGPGAVATKQRLWEKYHWTNVSAKITDYYPFDAYFQASAGQVCDSYDTYKRIMEKDLPARVLLVPKDSRGPRLISSESVDKQWAQQGLGKAIVELVESHELTKFEVFFTDQGPNQYGALLGSITGKYATLDLKEASDRVSLSLVRLLFPAHVYTALEACRSSSTVLPDGRELMLRKFAPMGSSLCFPILALTIWAILRAGLTDTDLREKIHVYGDDVIVPTEQSEYAIELLESFGLLVNRDKSCTSGFFRESCGVDAFKGVKVTPVRFRTVWSSEPSPDVYASWVAYANQFYDRRFFTLYDLIVENLLSIYGRFIPTDDDGNHHAVRLRELPEDKRANKFRTNSRLQRRELRVWTVRSPTINKEIDGWSMLLRYFVESQAYERTRKNREILSKYERFPRQSPVVDGLDYFRVEEPFSVRSYTRRDTSMLVKRWR